MSRERLSALDAAFLSLDSDVELMALLLDVAPAPEPDAQERWVPRSRPSPTQLATEAMRHQLDQTLDLARVPLGWARDPRRLLDLPGQAWRVARAVAHTAQPL